MGMGGHGCNLKGKCRALMHSLCLQTEPINVYGYVYIRGIKIGEAVKRSLTSSTQESSLLEISATSKQATLLLT